jgi:hypothetical protein
MSGGDGDSRDYDNETEYLHRAKKELRALAEVRRTSQPYLTQLKPLRQGFLGESTKLQQLLACYRLVPFKTKIRFTDFL